MLTRCGFIGHPLRPAVPLYCHPTVAPSHRPAALSSRCPTVPPPCRSVVPPSHRPAVLDLVRRLVTFLGNAVLIASSPNGAFEPRGLGSAAPAAVSPHYVGPLDGSASPGLLPFAGLIGPVFPSGFSVLHQHLFRTVIFSCFTSPSSRSHGSCRIVPQGLVVRFGLGLDAFCKIKSNQIKSNQIKSNTLRGAGLRLYTTAPPPATTAPGPTPARQHHRRRSVQVPRLLCRTNIRKADVAVAWRALHCQLRTPSSLTYCHYNGGATIETTPGTQTRVQAIECKRPSCQPLGGRCGGNAKCKCSQSRRVPHVPSRMSAQVNLERGRQLT